MGASLKVAWNAGELSPLLDGRTDLAKYQHGCSVLLNEIPTAHGPVYRRPGTRFVADCSSIAPVLVPFVFNRTQSYVLAFMGGYIAVYSDRGRVLGTGGTPYSFGYNIWDAPPRRADGTPRLSYTQSGDTLFVCDAEAGLPLLAIVRHDHADWSIEAYTMAVPPAGDWRNEYCCLYKTKADGTTAPEGQYYLAVNVGEISATYGISAGQWTETTNLSPADMSSNFFKERRRGKVFLDLTARIGSDQTANWTSDPINSAISACSLGRVVSYYSGMYAFHGQVISHNGRLYEPRVMGVVPSEPLHESQSGIAQNGLYYLGNGRVCLEIIESGIEDTIHDSDGTSSSIYCALVKIADQPENYDSINDRAFARYSSVESLVSTVGTFQPKSAMLHFKCFRWAPAAIRDFIPETMVTPLPTIGDVPDNVSIFRERLVLSVNRRQRMSVAGDFPNFSAYDGSGHVVADCALDLDLLSGDLSPVSWMAPAQKLVLGSFGGERAIGEQNISNAFGPTNVKVDFSTSNGSRDVPPVIVGSDVLYIDRSGRRVRRSGLALDPQDAADLSVLSEHIGASSPFIDSAWQQSPSSVMWLVQADGNLCGLTYDRAQDVVAWHRHDIGGDVLSICSIPSPDGTRDDLWLVVRRVLGASTKIYLEVMPDDFTLGRSVADQCFLDCSLTYEGAATLTISGLDHLKGQTVQALAKGFVIPDLVVSSAGAVTLPSMYEKVHVGLNHPSRIRTMRLEKAPDGVSQGKIGRIHRVVLRLMDSVGVKLGPSFVKMDLMEFRVATMAMDDAVPIQTLDLSCNFPGDYEDANYVCIEQGQPLPLTILSAAIEFELQT